MQHIKRISEPDPVTRETEHVEELVMTEVVRGQARNKTDESEFCLVPLHYQDFLAQKLQIKKNLVFLNMSVYSLTFSVFDLVFSTRSLYSVMWLKLDLI